MNAAFESLLDTNECIADLRQQLDIARAQALHNHLQYREILKENELLKKRLEERLCPTFQEFKDNEEKSITDNYLNR